MQEKVIEVWDQVMMTYPKTDKEKCCQLHRKKMEFKREQLYKRLMDEWEREKKIFTGISKGEQPL